MRKSSGGQNLRRNSPMSEFENNGLGPEGSYYDHLKQKEAEENAIRQQAQE